MLFKSMCLNSGPLDKKIYLVLRPNRLDQLDKIEIKM